MTDIYLLHMVLQSLILAIISKIHKFYKIVSKKGFSLRTNLFFPKIITVLSMSNYLSLSYSNDTTHLCSCFLQTGQKSRRLQLLTSYNSTTELILHSIQTYLLTYVQNLDFKRVIQGSTEGRFLKLGRTY